MSDYGVITEAATVRFERLLPGPIERVWEYLTQADKRATWFAGGEMELRRGGKVELRFRHADISQPDEVPPEKYRKVHEEGLTTYGEITRCEPPRLLSFVWGNDGEVTFELFPRGKDVLLQLTHSRLPDKTTLLSVSGGWHTHLDMLAARLAGRTPPPFWATHATRSTEYETRLGAAKEGR
jgi:uncharacterized protein YndB with AHSA1/START domain